MIADLDEEELLANSRIEEEKEPPKTQNCTMNESGRSMPWEQRRFSNLPYRPNFAQNKNPSRLPHSNHFDRKRYYKSNEKAREFWHKKNLNQQQDSVNLKIHMVELMKEPQPFDIKVQSYRVCDIYEACRFKIDNFVVVFTTFMQSIKQLKATDATVLRKDEQVFVYVPKDVSYDRYIEIRKKYFDNNGQRRRAFDPNSDFARLIYKIKSQEHDQAAVAAKVIKKI